MSLHDANDIFRSLDRELWIVTAAHGGRRGGLVSTTVVSASIVPDLPRILVAIAHQHATASLIEGSGGFVLHLVAPSQVDRVWTFGTQSSRDIDKFAGCDAILREGKTGAPILTDAPGWLECRVESRMETGDRTVYLAEVIDAGRDAAADKRPLTMHGLLNVATPQQRQVLQESLTVDGAVDAAAIRTWRQNRNS
ncbi:MAG: flavin reductase [Planctomycetaceae bacterium]|nr:flavin reductase [Planctomycetaceae bacterium]